MSLQLQKSKSPSFTSFQEDITSDFHEYSEVISFLERIKQFEIPEYSEHSEDILSLFDLRSDNLSLANN